MADISPTGDASPRPQGDSDVDMQPLDSDSRRRKNRVHDDEDGDEDDDDDEGIDLRPGAGSPGDSSEEEETDSEEEREIRKGFIVDEDESRRRGRHRKKKRSRKHAKTEEGEEAAGDGDEGSSRKRRKDSDDEDEALDEDDLELLQENLGIRRSKPKGKLRRLRRRRSVGSDDDAASPPRGLNDIFADDDAAADQVENLFDADEMAGFIEDDTDDSRSQAGDSDEDRDDARERRNRKQKERERRKAESAAKRKRGGLGGGRLEGVSVEAWQEVAEVFGNGQEYAWAMDDEDEDEPKPKDLKDIFEPSEIASRMLTEADEKIRTTDVPERQQLASVGLPAFDINDEGDLQPLIPEREIAAAAIWASDKVSREATQSFLLRDADGNQSPLYEPFIKAVEAVLRFINIDLLEPPHIWHHRSDYIIHAPPGEQQALLLHEHDLWQLASLSIKYRALMARRKEFEEQYRPLQTQDLHLAEILEQAGSVEDMMDALGWLSLRYGDELALAKQAKVEDQEGADALQPQQVGEDGLPLPQAAAAAGAGAAGPKRMKRAVRDNEYDTARKSVVKKFADLVGMSVAEVAMDVSMQQKTNFPDDPEKSPLDLADEYVVAPDFPVKERVIEGAETLLVTEFGHEPILRKEARRYIRDFGVVSVRPTATGQSKIDRLNPFYAFKYLKNKPVAEFMRSPQWMQILAAEAEGLVQSEITLPEQALEKFLGDLQRIYLSDFSSTIADEWNALRSKILDRASREHLFPQAITWARNMLKEESEDVIGAACKDRLEARLDAAPYKRADDTMEAGQVPSVLAISSGRGDPKRDSVVGVFLDTDGHFREHIKIDNLFDPEEKQREAFTDLLKRRRPQVVVVGGYSSATMQLLDNFRNFAARVTQELLDEGVEDDNELDEGLDATETASRKANRAAFESTYVHDEVARIYQNSARATLEFPDLSTLGKYCIGLARYAQSPLNEYAALGQDLGALSYSPNQKYLSKEKVDQWLERALIEVTNRVGVDINRCVRSTYYAYLLPYVSGLGPRKAEALLKKINGIGGTLSTRQGLVLHGLTTKNIFVNVAGFLRIRQDDLDADLGRDAENSEDPDPLDDTRIHPEDYDVARKMAADAMDYDEEDLEGAPPSKAVLDLFNDDPSKLNDLALDEFAAELTKVLNAPKRFVLYKIREELQQPFSEKRSEFKVPSAEERFTMWTGETRRTLDAGYIIPVRVIRVSQDESVVVRLDCGIDGMVGHDYRTDGQVLTRLTPGQTLQAMVMKVDYDALRVELTTRESLLQAGDLAQRQVTTDTWFDTAAALADQQVAAKSSQKSAGGRAKRVIKHPNFQDISAGKAEEFLAGMQRGDCVIRPSSREDHLAVTWKVDEGIYQHLAVHELNKPNEYSLGTQLRVSDKHRYSDLDELIDAHIKQMARKVTELTSNDRFKGSQESLDKYLTTWTLANPGKSIYAFGWNSDRKKAGQVVLGFRTNERAPISRWDVAIVPEGYMLKGQVHGDVQSLVNAFKHAYQYSMQNGPRAGGAVPPQAGYGGRTPGYPGVPGSRTPNPAMQQGHATPMGAGVPAPGGYGAGYYSGGRTPMNGYSGGRTPMGGPAQGGYGGAPQSGMGSGRTPLPPSYR